MFDEPSVTPKTHTKLGDHQGVRYTVTYGTLAASRLAINFFSLENLIGNFGNLFF